MRVYPSAEEVLIYEGRAFAAEWYYTSGGVMPAFDYYKRLPEVDQERFDHIVAYFCDRPYGTRLPKSWYRIEDTTNGIYAFKPRDERFFNFMTAGRKVIVTNAYRKHAQKMTRQDLEELKMSMRYRNDYFERIREGTYYER